MTTYLFIDGENFLHKLEDALIQQGIEKKKIDSTHVDLKKLIQLALPNEHIALSTFYAAKLHVHEASRAKSLKLIQEQRILKTNLEKQGFTFVLAGNVRPQIITVNGKSKTIFREKGVDVRLAVDLVSLSCDKVIDRAIMCSSDSDLQPAIAEARKRGVEVVYLGFEASPNKGLTYTTNRTVLFRNSEIVQIVPMLP
ncbi:MAG: NYN domain-containing protein [Patescibacteria group bacterium]